MAEKDLTARRPKKVLLAKTGLDAHDRGIKIIARTLRDAGMEVVFLGLFQTPEAVVKSAVQEDADVIGLSMLSGVHVPVVAKIMELLKQENAGHISIVCGGIIPSRDVPRLRELGVKEVFHPGTPLEKISDFFTNQI